MPVEMQIEFAKIAAELETTRLLGVLLILGLVSFVFLFGMFLRRQSMDSEGDLIVITTLSDVINTFSKTVERLESTLGDLSENLGGLLTSINYLSDKIEVIDKKVDSLQNTVDKIEGNTDENHAHVQNVQPKKGRKHKPPTGPILDIGASKSGSG